MSQTVLILIQVFGVLWYSVYYCPHNLPVGHSDRLMSLTAERLRLPIQDKFATLIGVYAPTVRAETEVKEAFYCCLPA